MLGLENQGTVPNNLRLQGHLDSLLPENKLVAYPKSMVLKVGYIIESLVELLKPMRPELNLQRV